MNIKIEFNLKQQNARCVCVCPTVKNDFTLCKFVLAQIILHWPHAPIKSGRPRSCRWACILFQAAIKYTFPPAGGFFNKHKNIIVCNSATAINSSEFILISHKFLVSAERVNACMRIWRASDITFLRCCEIEFEPKAVAKRDATGEEKRKKGRAAVSWPASKVTKPVQEVMFFLLAGRSGRPTDGAARQNTRPEPAQRVIQNYRLPL